MSVATWLMAQSYDRMMQRTEVACLKTWRSALVSPLQGEVLEIGAGTGANLPFYSRAVKSLVLTEPDPHMARKLRQHPRLQGRDHAVLSCPAENLALESGRFDAVVGTLVLCTVPDAVAALREVRRVLKPCGLFVFIEHVAAENNPGRLRWQRRIEPLWKRMACGCCLTRTTAQTIAASGLVIEEMETSSLQHAPSWVRTSIRGFARK